MSPLDRFSPPGFDPSTVSVTMEPNVPQLFSCKELISLSGAISNSMLNVSYTGLFIKLEVKHPAILEMSRELFYDIDRSCWVIYNSKFCVQDEYRRRYLGVRSITVQARAAQRIGVGRILAYAKGNCKTFAQTDKAEQWLGYWLWPRVGFDAYIPEAIRSRLSTGFQNCWRLSELIATEAGAYEWYLRGDSINVEFDLTPGSSSWQTLERYIARRAIEV